MKKFAKVMAVALVAVMALAVLVACGPASDPEKAAKALKDNGYTVASVIGSDSTEGKLAQASLDVVAKAMGLKAGDLVASVTGTKGEDGIMIYYFKSAKVARDYWNDHKEDIEKQKKEAKEEGQDLVINISGSVVYSGTKQAVKDAR